MTGPRVKSPHYPTMNLEAAIKMARKLGASLGRGPVSRQSAIVSGLGLSQKSSQGQRSMAALLSFGLWEKAGKGMVRQSERGRRILAAPDLAMAAKEVCEAALMPKIHRRVMQQWPDKLPEDDTGMLGFLRMEWDFNPDAASPFIREVRETFKFAKVYENATLPLDLGENSEDGDDDEDGNRTQDTTPIVESGVVRQPKPIAPPPPPRTPGGGRQTMELTSFPLEGGGRIVLEAPIPTPGPQFKRLGEIAEAITRELSEYLETGEAEESRSEDAAP